ncbi:MAG: hypothetical protein HLUCCO16_21805 [Phormidium sp. OSCR]|nr:MAG: hypothetical protein HLUCCO16_21805 [Phormidium sp. OSCR]
MGSPLLGGAGVGYAFCLLPFAFCLLPFALCLLPSYPLFFVLFRPTFAIQKHPAKPSPLVKDDNPPKCDLIGTFNALMAQSSLSDNPPQPPASQLRQMENLLGDSPLLLLRPKFVLGIEFKCQQTHERIDQEWGENSSVVEEYDATEKRND